jgi:hypothetical protein
VAEYERVGMQNIVYILVEIKRFLLSQTLRSTPVGNTLEEKGQL